MMLQGARHDHISSLNEASRDLGLDIEIIEIRKLNELKSSNPDAIVLPGGESTTMRKVGQDKSSNLIPGIFDWVRQNPSKTVLGTCAGAILLADPQDGKLPLVEAQIDRNAYGPQNESFQGIVNSSLLDREFPGIFIRAPRIISSENEVCARMGEEIVGVKNGRVIALTFHPELSKDKGFHKWLLKSASGE